jgi:hypothetical protein
VNEICTLAHDRLDYFGKESAVIEAEQFPQNLARWFDSEANLHAVSPAYSITYCA